MTTNERPSSTTSLRRGYDALTRHDTTRHTRLRRRMGSWFARCRRRTHEPKEPKPMNTTETAELLRTRRGLTGETYNDDTVAAWLTALGDADYVQCRDAVVRSSKTEKRITVAHVVAQLPNTRRRPADGHSSSCMCMGRGWLLIDQHDNHGNTWTAWDRCPNGPRTGFVEVD